MRKGFSLITAIIFLFVVATLSILALSMSTQSAKQTTDQYLKIEAELLAKSATEYALLAISGHEVNATNGCLNHIDIKYPTSGTNYTHDVNITIQYIGDNLPASPKCTQLGTDIVTADSNRTVIIDTIVTTNPTVSLEPIRIHRRTIQKP
ncbi:type IV pilus modification PilV family protein [Sulfurospirillum sp. 1612]|uniref:type IV pilus modification PilV family protein n=1 Tax=Sulfurospirillum sp. 1612 TaxID=3094835 RepID=UPI002F933C69